MPKPPGLLNDYMAPQPTNALMRRFDPRYDPDANNAFLGGGLYALGERRVFPTPEFVPDYAFKDSAFVMPPNERARDLSFDGMDLADRQYYRDRMFAPPQAPRMRRF